MEASKLLSKLRDPKLWLIGVRYQHGKILIYRGNPGEAFPSWAIDMREVLLIFFMGVAALFLIYLGHVDDAKELLLVLAGYVFGRTVPGGVRRYMEASE